MLWILTWGIEDLFVIDEISMLYSDITEVWHV
jgi:hypothetical protein